MKTTIPAWEGITLRVKFNRRPRVVVRAEGWGPMGRAGGRLLPELAERSALHAELSRALAALAERVQRHDPARVLVDLAVAAGAECISYLPCFGSTCSCSKAVLG